MPDPIQPAPLDLDAIEGRARALTYALGRDHIGAVASFGHTVGDQDVPALVAEVRRLRALVDEPLRPRRISLPRPPGCDRHPTDAHPGDCPDCRDLWWWGDLGEHPTATSRAEGCPCDACTKGA